MAEPENPRAEPPRLVPRELSREEKYFRKEESLECEAIAEREGDRLLKENDRVGAEVAHRVAAMIRLRRKDYLELF